MPDETLRALVEAWREAPLAGFRPEGRGTADAYLLTVRGELAEHGDTREGAELLDVDRPTLALLVRRAALARALRDWLRATGFRDVVVESILGAAVRS